MRDGEVTDVDALAGALKAFFAANKLGKHVRLGVANQRIVVRTLDLPVLADAKELDAAVRFQAQEHIPMTLDLAVLDYETLGLVQTNEGERTRVILVAARRDMVERLLAAVRQAGLRPEGIDLSAFAMIRALDPGAQAEASSVLYVNVGGLTNLAIAEGSACRFTRVAAGGLEGMVAQLAERRALTLEHSRMWLGHVGLATPLEQVEGDAEIVSEARTVLSDGVRRIADDVRTSIDYYPRPGGDGDRRARHAHRPGRGDPRLHRAARHRPRHDCRSRPRCRGQPRRDADGRGRPVDHCRGPRRRGALVRAVNLIPPEQRRGGGAGSAGRTGGAVYVLLGGLGIVLVALAAWVLTSNSISDNKAQLAKVNQEANVATAQAAALRPFRDFAQMRANRVLTVQSLARSRFDWQRAFTDLARVIPSDVWLTTMVATVKPGVNFGGGGGAADTGDTGQLRGDLAVPAIEMVGCTTDQAEVARVLTRLRLITGVQRVSLASSTKSSAAVVGSAASTDSGAAGAGSDDCRHGSRNFPKFSVVIFFDSPPASTVPGAAGAATGGSAPSAGTAPTTAGQAGARAASTAGASQ